MFWFGVVRFEIVGEKILDCGKKPRREIPGFHQKCVGASLTEKQPRDTKWQL
jgi:hypothetical protein